MINIGVDPGGSGGIAALEGEHVLMLSKFEGRTDQEIVALFKMAAGFEGPKMAYLELVGSMPGQGVASTFKFGDSNGFLRACLVFAGIPFLRVTPAQWKTRMSIAAPGASKTRLKQISRQKAQQLFPSQPITNATAEALLLAIYCQRTYLPQLPTFPNQYPGTDRGTVKP